MFKGLIALLAGAVAGSLLVFSIAAQSPGWRSDGFRAPVDFDLAFADIPAAADTAAANSLRARLYRVGMKRMDAVSYAEWMSVVQYP